MNESNDWGFGVLGVAEQMKHGSHGGEDGGRWIAIGNDFGDQRRLHFAHLLTNGLNAIENLEMGIGYIPNH